MACVGCVCVHVVLCRCVCCALCGCVLCWCWCLVVVVLCAFLFPSFFSLFLLLSSFPLSLFSLLSSLPLPLLSSLLANQHCGKNRSTNTAANFEALEDVMWRTAGAQQSVLSSPLPSLLPSPQKKEEGTFNYRNISRRGNYFITVFKLIPKNRCLVEITGVTVLN